MKIGIEALMEAMVPSRLQSSLGKSLKRIHAQKDALQIKRKGLTGYAVEIRDSISKSTEALEKFAQKNLACEHHVRENVTI